MCLLCCDYKMTPNFSYDIFQENLVLDSEKYGTYWKSEQSLYSQVRSIFNIPYLCSNHSPITYYKIPMVTIDITYWMLLIDPVKEMFRNDAADEVCHLPRIQQRIVDKGGGGRRLIGIGISRSLIWSKPWWNCCLTPVANFGEVRRAQLAKSTLISSLVSLESFQIF